MPSARSRRSACAAAANARRKPPPHASALEARSGTSCAGDCGPREARTPVTSAEGERRRDADHDRRHREDAAPRQRHAEREEREEPHRRARGPRGIRERGGERPSAIEKTTGSRLPPAVLAVRRGDERLASRQGADPAEPSRTRLAWRRAVVLALPVLYVAGSAVKIGESSPRAWLAIAIGIAVALFGSLSHPGETTRQGRDRLWTSGALALDHRERARSPSAGRGSASRARSRSIGSGLGGGPRARRDRP